MGRLVLKVGVLPRFTASGVMWGPEEESQTYLGGDQFDPLLAGTLVTSRSFRLLST